MKRLLLFFVCMSSWCTIWALELTGSYIMQFYNRFSRYATVDINYESGLAAGEPNVIITNLFNYGTLVTAYYDENAQTLRIPAGQVLSNTDKPLYLYSFTSENNSERIVDKVGDIILDIKENSTSNTLVAQRGMVVTYDDGSIVGSFKDIQLRNNSNSTLTCDVLNYQNANDIIRTENYPVKVTLVEEGKYMVENFGQRTRLYLYTHRDGTATTTFGDYPYSYSSTLKNYYFPCAFEWKTDRYTSSKDRTIYGTIEGKHLSFSSIWDCILDNTNNTDVAEDYRHVYRYSSEMRKNTVITLDNGRFLVPHTTHEVTAKELLLTTKNLFDAKYAEGWMWTGNKDDDATVIEISNKKSTIEPGSDNVIAEKIYSGLNIKNNGNGTKNVYMRVKGISGLKFYVTSNGNDERTAVVSVTPIEGETITENITSSKDGAVGRVEGLDEEQSYTIEYYTTENDMTLYAVQFLKGSIDDGENEQIEPKTHLVVWSKDGKKVAYALAEKPKVTFTDTDLIITANGVEVNYSLENMARFTYEGDTTTAITNLQTGESSFKLDGESLFFPDLKANSTVSLYSLNGTLIFSKTVRMAGEYSFPLFGLNAGVYVVTVDGLTYKIVKR